MMLQFSFVFVGRQLRAHGSARCHNNTRAYFVSRWEKEAERDDYFRAAPTRRILDLNLNSACYILS